MESLKLKAEVREKIGGLSSKTSIYKESKIPGIIYGGKDEPQPILVKNNELLKIINNEDQSVALNVKNEIESINTLINKLVDQLNNGGRLFYIGSGTSGR